MNERVRPGWQDVEELLTRLVRTRARFPSATFAANSISQYEPGSRLLLENDNGSRWVRIGDIRDCWETFERLGRIHRRDVLDPGRCSGFLMALFAQVDGVAGQSAGGEDFLALPAVDRFAG